MIAVYHPVISAMVHYAHMLPSLPWFLLATGLAGAGIFVLKSQKNTRTPPSRISSNILVDISALAEQGKLEPLGGREAETERMIHILMRKSKNNPLLIGNPGVGKTALIHALAQAILHGDVPLALMEKRILALDLNALMAGTQNRGALEGKVQELLKTIQHDARRTILFIDEVHMLEQANGSTGSLNLSDMLKPALSMGDVQVIGATTWDEYERYIRPDQALDRRFQPVLVNEPSPKHALLMLKAVREIYEEHHHVTIPDTALRSAITLSKSIRGRYLPDKAIDLIDEAAAKVAIECTQTRHGAHLGLLHAAAKSCKNPTVSTKDIQNVVAQWTAHTNAKKESQR